MPRAAALALAATLALSATAFGQQAITGADIAAHLDALARIAAENGGNRAAGEPGEAATANYVAEQLAAAGWAVSRTDVAFDYWKERTPPTVGAHRPGRDFVSLYYSGSGDVTARVQPVNRGGCRRGHFRRFARGRIALLTAAGCT
ncbi:MAG TPA: hypothetical protein VF587_13500, partial [Solirubrobacteraceae bacterium]